MDERTADTGQVPFAQAPFLCAREAAAELGVNERTIRRAIDRGDLRAVKRAGIFRIAPQELARYRATKPKLVRSAPQYLSLVSRAPRRNGPAGQLPAPLTPFIGRVAEATLVRRCSSDRMSAS